MFGAMPAKKARAFLALREAAHGAPEARSGQASSWYWPWWWSRSSERDRPQDPGPGHGRDLRGSGRQAASRRGRQGAVRRRPACPRREQLRGHALQDGPHPRGRHRFPEARVPHQRGAGDVLRRQHLPLAAGLRPEHPGHEGGPQAPRRHREEAEPAPAELLRHPPARRHPLPRHQRRRQHPAGPPAGLRAARELGPDGARHRHHDVHRVLAAGPDRAGRAAALRGGRRRHRLPQPEALRRAVEEHRRAQRPDRGILLRPRPGPGLRPGRGHAGALRRTERGPLQGQLRGPVRLRHDHAGHAVRLVPQLRGHRRGRWFACGLRFDEPGRCHGVHPVLARVHPAAGPDGRHGQHAAVRCGLGGAGLRVPRRRGAGRRDRHRAPAGQDRRPRRVQARHVQLHPGQAADRGPVVHGGAGAHRRDRRSRRAQARPPW